GRGLSALMADVVAEEPQLDGSTARKTDQLIAIDKIHPNPDQPRRTFNQSDLDELAASIREKGIIQPLILRSNPTETGAYEIVAGERRWRAAQIARLHQVPALIREYTDTETLEIAIIENIQRADLNAIEEAAGYRDLMDRFGHTQEKLGEALGKSRSHIANLLRLLNLPDSVQNLLREDKLTAGHARTLVTAKNPEGLAHQIVSRGLSVREAEKLVKREGTEKVSNPRKNPEKDADTRRLEDDLSATLEMKVAIDHKPNGQSGRVTVQYKDLDELDEICRRLTAVLSPND
ncbi:MAG: ParB/RepB/Spo0J family partition protein, partial [Rhodobacteraceae bacterium]|nr:ParB/RepB/Spo0J family partition protein [Paracoccaceae bacterium]